MRPGGGVNGAPPPRLAFFGPAWFALVMGLSGLALAWHRAVPLMYEAAGAVAALDAPVALALAFGLRLRRHPEARAEDRRHPVRHPFMAALPVSLMLLALASLLVAALLLATVRGLRDGSLLAPEPVASIQPVQAPAG